MTDKSLPEILTLEQAASYLQLPVDEVLRELEIGLIPAYRFNSGWRIKKDVLDRLLEGYNPGIENVKAESPNPSPPKDDTTIIPEPPATSLTPDVTKQISALSSEQDTIATSSDLHFSIPDANDNDQTKLAETSSPSIVSSISLLPPLEDGREYVKVFSYNIEQGYGRGRLLSNNSYVFLDSRNLLDHDYRPFPGDIVAVKIGNNKKRGPEGIAIKLISRGNRLIQGITTVDNSSSSKELPKPKTALPPQKIKTPPRVNNKATATKDVRIDRRSALGTAKSRELFQKAAVAQVNGRLPEAKRLFREAIQAGAGTDVYTAFFKMENQTGSHSEARRIMNEAIDLFPTHTVFYDMYGQMERRAHNYAEAEQIFRAGLSVSPDHPSLQWGLAQTLVQAGTDEGMREAGEIFAKLDRERKLQKTNRLYQRYVALQNNPRANRAYDFFSNGGMRVGITGRRDLDWYITDIVAETSDQELSESFGLSGGFLVRCFKREPQQIDIHRLKEYLQGMGTRHVVGLLEGREVLINSNVAFIAVPNVDAVDDQIMAVLGESTESIVPLDDNLLGSGQEPLKTLQDMLTRYLARRDLYNSTLPVYGRRFFGREKDMLELMDQVHNGQFVGIYGLRKMGKTSLILQLRNEKLMSALVAYLDLQQNNAQYVGHCGPIYWQLERLLYERLIELESEAANLMRLGTIDRYSELSVELVNQAHIIFSEDLRSLLDGITAGNFPGIGRVVIVLDELESILPVGDSKRVDGYLQLFGLLRGLAQMARYEGRLSSVVVAANAAISEQGYWGGQENPVFGLYKPHYLKPLLPKEFAQMIVTLGKGMSVYWEQDAVEEAFRETGGHPFLGRLLCSRITKHPPKPLTVTLPMVQDAVPIFIRDDGDKLEQIIALLHVNFPGEEKLLKQIALGQVGADLPDDSLRHLLGYNLVAIEDGEYHITINMLRRWLRRHGGIRE